MKTKIAGILLFIIVSSSLFLGGILTGCTQTDSTEEEEFNFRITDQLGRVVTLNKMPERIISLAPSNTEILFALGLEDKLVAVTDYCNYPLAAQDKPSIGGFSTPNMEEIIALSPDLILATSRHEEKIIPQLEEKGMTVFGLNARTIDEVMAAITLTGQLTGKEKEASDIVAEMQKRIAAVTDKTDGLTSDQKPGVGYLVWHDPPMSAASGTLQDELIKMAGGINIVGDLTDYAKVSLEEILASNPQVMIAGVGHGTGGDLTLEFLMTESRLSDTDARQNDRIYGVNGDIASRPGPRIVDALEEFAKFLHPELFE